MRISVAEWKRLSAKHAPKKKAAKRSARPVKFVRPQCFPLFGYVRFELPMKVESLQNLREHWTTEAKRKRREKATVLRWLALLWPAGTDKIAPPLCISLIRLAPRRLDHSNAVGGFKYIQDTVAKWIGIDDGSPLLTWEYDQKNSAEYGCRIVIQRRVA